MWLLDHNVPRQVHHVLNDLGIRNATTKHLGWENLKNGVLTKTAYDAGIRCILTLDRLFHDDASTPRMSSRLVRISPWSCLH